MPTNLSQAHHHRPLDDQVALESCSRLEVLLGEFCIAAGFGNPQTRMEPLAAIRKLISEHDENGLSYGLSQLLCLPFGWLDELVGDLDDATLCFDETNKLLQHVDRQAFRCLMESLAARKQVLAVGLELKGITLLSPTEATSSSAELPAAAGTGALEEIASNARLPRYRCVHGNGCKKRWEIELSDGSWRPLTEEDRRAFGEPLVLEYARTKDGLWELWVREADGGTRRATEDEKRRSGVGLESAGQQAKILWERITTDPDFRMPVPDARMCEYYQWRAGLRPDRGPSRGELFLLAAEMARATYLGDGSKASSSRPGAAGVQDVDATLDQQAKRRHEEAKRTFNAFRKKDKRHEAERRAEEILESPEHKTLRQSVARQKQGEYNRALAAEIGCGVQMTGKLLTVQTLRTEYREASYREHTAMNFDDICAAKRIAEARSGSPGLDDLIREETREVLEEDYRRNLVPSELDEDSPDHPRPRRVSRSR